MFFIIFFLAFIWLSLRWVINQCVITDDTFIELLTSLLMSCNACLNWNCPRGPKRKLSCMQIYACMYVNYFLLVIRELLLAWRSKLLAEVMHKYMCLSKSKLYFAENSLHTRPVGTFLCSFYFLLLHTCLFPLISSNLDPFQEDSFFFNLLTFKVLIQLDFIKYLTSSRLHVNHFYFILKYAQCRYGWMLWLSNRIRSQVAGYCN